MKTELFVELVVPDTEALTTLNTLKKMGYDEVEKICRRDYYCAEGDEYFYDQLSSNDLLVNVNKHRCFPTNKVPEDRLHYVSVLVTDSQEDETMKNVLSSRFSIGLSAFRKGTLWLLGFSSQDSAERTAREIANKLLYNKHYQEVEFW